MTKNLAYSYDGLPHRHKDNNPARSFARRFARSTKKMVVGQIPAFATLHQTGGRVTSIYCRRPFQYGRKRRNFDLLQTDDRAKLVVTVSSSILAAELGQEEKPWKCTSAPPAWTDNY